MKKLRLLFIRTTLATALLQFIFAFNVKAQLTTTRAGNYATMNYLVNKVLLGSKSGMVATNVTYQGIDTSFGFFNGKTSNIGMDSGVIITNGTIALAAGPNQKTTDVSDSKWTTYAFSTTDGWPASNTYHDTDLANLISTTVSNTYSCAVLQFDFIAISDSVQFQYSFGSNEEPHYVGSAYLDDFGFFLSGPGIAGTFSHSAINLALIPFTTTAVYINSVNCTTNPAYYVCNWPASTGCSTCPASTAVTTVGYNGFTTVLVAKAAVQCGKKYHIKIGVADIGNGKFDSGVFLKGGSFAPAAGTTTVSSSATNVCAGNSATLTASGAATYTWTPSTGLSATTGASVIATPTASITYTVVGNAGGCGDTAFIAVNVTPSTPATLTVSADTICPGGNTTLTVNGTGLSYLWSNGPTTSSITVSPGATTTYSVVGTNSCSNDTLKQIITVLPTINPVIAGNDSVCLGSSTTLTATGGTNYVWNTGATTSSINVSPVTNTTYTVTTPSGKCPSAQATFTVSVGTPLTPAVSGIDSVCSGNSTTLTASGGGNYIWSNGATTSSIVVSPASNTKYSVYTSNVCGTDSSSLIVIVLPPSNPVITGNDSVCSGTATVLSVTGGSNYVWSNGSTNSTIVVSPLSNATYSVTSGSGKCIGSASYNVYIRPKPAATIIGTSTTCQNDTIILTAGGGGNYSWSNGATTSTLTYIATKDSNFYVVVTKGCADTAFQNITIMAVTPIAVCCDTTIMSGGTAKIGASGAVGYVWSPSSSVDCYTCPVTTATPGSSTTYTVVGTDANGCRSTGTVTVDVECADFIVPNVFTPNGDNINDNFLIKAYSQTTYSIEIYNRWGVLVFKSDTPYAPWDGHDESGQVVSDGVYYYIIKSKCGTTEYDHHGFVQVIK